ncbi:MAG: nicotinate phosphoribosyltransferase [Thermofilaceae archaeon]|nr:nicotinate phosphoribosyltransferase [Thermofilaceae archaeon]MCX8181048.1 nicotinate phosphoribosyltransferase [Thermofilaceae archaeon]MDW8004529.1 nicotinate phosphoribosyltransferase [Thermofilaceae archaeon]
MTFIYATADEIKGGKTTDVYFLRTLETLKKEGLGGVEVYAEVTVSALPKGYKWAVYAGLREVLHLLEGKKVNVFSLHEGTLIKPSDYRGIRVPVMALEGPYEEFALHETALLGFLASASGVATKAARVKKAAGRKMVLSFGARRTHPAIAPFVDYYAFIGGCESVSCVKGAELLGIKPSGTMPHSLMIIFKAVKGDHTEAWIAFDRHVDPEVPRIVLADTFSDEVEESLNAATRLGSRLWGVRLDTPGSRRGDMAAIVREVKWKLKAAGFKNIKIVVSGGLDEHNIPELAEAGADVFGVGSAIANAAFVDYALDITAVKVNGSWIPIAKRGKLSGRKLVHRCWSCMADVVTLEHEPLPQCPNCGKQMEEILVKVMEWGHMTAEIEQPQYLREKILRQIDKVDLL